MKRILIFGENETLARQLLTPASALDGPVTLAVIHETAAKAAAACTSGEVVLLEGGSARPEDYAHPLADLARQLDADLLLVADTVSGRELAACTAAHLDVALVSGARQIRKTSDGLETERILYGGAAVKTETLKGLAVITVPPGLHAPIDQQPGGPVAIRRAAVGPDRRVRVLGNRPIERKTVGLGSSKVVVGVGLGFDSQADLQLAQALADSLHAALGCSRPLADDKRWMPGETYIGISGENIHPDVYIAVGISGQVQHMVGVRDAKTIIAINKNENAPIFKAADYGIVGDLYKVLPLLTAAIKSR